MASTSSTSFHWLKNGAEAFPSMLDAIHAARESVFLETYHFEDSDLGRRFLDALVQARKRGASVQVVIDFLGSSTLLSSFWTPLTEAGGEFRWFNPWNPKTLGIRNHRKILVCDESTAFVGGFNISPEYDGDGIEEGWRDLGLKIHGSLAKLLAECVQQSFAIADFRYKPLQRFRKNLFNRKVSHENWTLLLGGPGRGHKYLKRAIAKDIQSGEWIKIISAYFLPTWRIRRALLKKSKSGGRVDLILPEKSDVFFSQLATRCLYGRMLRAGIRIHEYLPQILHAKLIIIGDIIYVGSCNLDRRSLNLNYEILLRIEDAHCAKEARKLFEEDLTLSKRIEIESWKNTQPFWQKWFGRIAYYFLSRVDPYFSHPRKDEIP